MGLDSIWMGEHVVLFDRNTFPYPSSKDGRIPVPEKVGNLCFGGPKNNRLYMASSHSLYALYVEAHGAV